jgi:hypothetical protein
MDEKMAQVYEKEMASFKIIGRMGGVFEIFKTIAPEDSAEINKRRTALSEAVDKKNYDEALEQANALYNTVEKYGKTRKRKK